VDEDLEGAKSVLLELANVGIDLDDVTDTLLREGLASFQKSFDTLLVGLTKKAGALGLEMATVR
jgi:transaldolase/glucose-6-phosphate isomerase